MLIVCHAKDAPLNAMEEWIDRIGILDAHACPETGHLYFWQLTVGIDELVAATRDATW
jgi:hypothetical protein